MKIPKSSKAVVLPAYNKNLLRAIISLKIEDVELPKLCADELLIKVLASPCNPSDIAFLQGSYNVVKDLPAIPGFEATGEVIDAGENAKLMIGNRVSCFSQDEKIGCWSEFMISKVQNCIVLKDGLDIFQAATVSINPLTAFGMFEMAMQNSSKTILLNAAGGQVAEFIRAFAKKNNVEVINIFRKKNTFQNIEPTENQINLYSDEENFEENLRLACDGKSNITAFDAVGGFSTGLIFNNLPPKSSIIVYGGLSNEVIGGIDVLDMIFRKKQIIGFNLNDYIEKLKTDGNFKIVVDKIQDMIINGEISTKINETFLLKDIIPGIRAYIKNMSAGKVIFKM